MKKTTLFSLLLGIIAYTQAQQTTTVPLDKYNTLYQSSSSTNKSNGAGTYFFVGQNKKSTNNLRRALLHFDLSSIPNDAVITDATLSLFMSKSIVGAKEVRVHRATADWGQGTSDAPEEEGGGATATANDASWNCNFSTDGSSCITAWNTVGGDFATTASASTMVAASGSYNWTATALITDIQAWIDTPASNFGWFLIGEEGDGTSAKRFDATTANAPTLSITYTSATLGVIETSFTEQIHVAPNPTAYQTRISLANSYPLVTATVKNLIGQHIQTTTYTNTNVIDVVLDGSAGVYLVSIEADTGQQALLKIVKQ